VKPLILAFGILLLPSAADAQVLVHQAALDQLAGIVAPAPPPAAPPAHKKWHRHIVVVSARTPGPPPRTAHPPVAPLQAPALPGMQAGTPPDATAPSAPPPAAPVLAAARTPAPPNATSPQAAKPAPLTIVFAPGSADLPPGTAAALKPFCKTAVPLGIDARAPGDASDPSVAMRLSLARALSIRDALAACGVASANIVPRARGNIPGLNDDAAVLGGPIK
jgi:hypothetical protein